MAKVIFTCRYLKGAGKVHIGNFLNYIATRENVDESLSVTMTDSPSTIKQQEKIAELTELVPDMKKSLEYDDYINNPTKLNASELITETISNNLDLFAEKENLVGYMALRPRAERICEHGLFSMTDDAIDLEKVQHEVAAHEGNIYNTVISLRREDAERLGYNNASARRDLVREKVSEISENMKIDFDDLQWYGAFHNESHHPHIHLLVYSKNPKRGYLTKKGIDNMRSSFANSIFKQDLVQIYDQKTSARNLLTEEAREKIESLVEDIQNAPNSNPQLENMLRELAGRLKNHKGKNSYGYLKPADKKVVDDIVKELASDSRIAELYKQWCDCQNKVLATYKSEFLEHPPLWEQKEFKSIKNAVIKSALQFGNADFFVSTEPTEENVPEYAEPEQSDEIYDAEIPSADAGDFYAAWNKEYKRAKNYLYGTKGLEKNTDKAMELFQAEAENGNVLAMHDLGQIHIRREEADTAQEYFEKALTGFLVVESHPSEKVSEDYLRFRIGRMYNMGYGTEQDYEAAAEWYTKAGENKYAQYSLGSLYFYGKGVEHNYTTALELYESSAAQSNAYAMYETAKMYEKGIGCDADQRISDYYYGEAFRAFEKLEITNEDDKLWYRLGDMHMKGQGTPPDIDKAIEYFEKAAECGNSDAQYALAKIYLQDESASEEKIRQAVEWLTKIADSGKDMAQYQLGKLYHNGRLYVPKDLKAAMSYYLQSAENGNQYARYQLGKLYLSGEEVPQDTIKAESWLLKSAEQENEYAQYTLGKLMLSDGRTESGIYWLEKSALQDNQYAQHQLGKTYFFGNGVERDIEKAIEYLTRSAEQGNEYAKSLLEHKEYDGQPLSFAVTRLLYELSRTIQNDTLNMGGKQIRADSKEMKKIMERKAAQGLKIE